MRRQTTRPSRPQRNEIDHLGIGGVSVHGGLRSRLHGQGQDVHREQQCDDRALLGRGHVQAGERYRQRVGPESPNLHHVPLDRPPAPTGANCP